MRSFKFQSGARRLRRFTVDRAATVKPRSGLKAALLCVICVICGLPAFAAFNVTFNWQNGVQTSVANKIFTVTPGFVQTNGTFIVTGDAITYITDTNGSCVVSNMVAGPYSASMKAFNSFSTITFTVPSGSGSTNASQILSTPPAANGATTGFTQAQSLAMFPQLSTTNHFSGASNVFDGTLYGNGGGVTNVNVANLTSVQTFTSAVNTNIIYMSASGVAVANGQYTFKDLETTQGIANCPVYTNNANNGYFLLYDPQDQVAAVITNVAGFTVDTTFYEYDDIATLDGAMFGSVWSGNGQGGALGASGAIPSPITQWGTTYTLVGNAANFVTNGDIYVDPVNGHDSTTSQGILQPWKTLTNAINFAASMGGGTVHIKGTNSVGITFIQPDNVALIGEGHGSTFINMMTNSGDPIILLGSNTFDQGFTISGYFQVSCVSNRMVDVHSVGIIDSLFFTGAWNYFDAWNCEFDSGFDTINATAGTISTSQAQFHNCSFHAIGSLPNNGGQGTGPSSGNLRCAAIGNGIFRFYAGSMEASGCPQGKTNSSNRCIDITGTAATVYVSGCQFKYDLPAGTNGWAHAVNYNGAGANTNAVFEFDGCIPNFSTNDVAGGGVAMLGASYGTNIVWNNATNSSPGTTGSVNRWMQTSIGGATYFFPLYK